MSAIDLNVVWIDKDRISYPVYLSRGDLLTCKLLFKRKGARILAEAIQDGEDMNA